MTERMSNLRSQTSLWATTESQELRRLAEPVERPCVTVALEMLFGFYNFMDFRSPDLEFPLIISAIVSIIEPCSARPWMDEQVFQMIIGQVTFHQRLTAGIAATA